MPAYSSSEKPLDFAHGIALSTENPVVSRRQDLLVGLLLLIIGVFYCVTIRAGHNWGDDFALYIHHAENIAHGHAYSDTGYIYNPSFPGVGPRNYPPIFPLLLAPVYYFYGLNLTAMKAEITLLFLLTLLSIYTLFRKELPFPYLLALLALLGFNPFFWDAKDTILSDGPFLLFFCLTANVAYYGRREGPTWWRWAALMGLALYLCYGTRTIGVMLLPGLALYDAVRWRRLTRFTLLASAVCGALIVAQWFVIGAGESSYKDEFHPSLSALAANIDRYGKDLILPWYAGATTLYEKTLSGLIALLALGGAYLRFRKGWTVLEFLLVFYVAFMVIWPKNQGVRLLLPLVPLYLYYVMLGLLALTRYWKDGRPAAVLAALLLLVGVDYANAYRKANFAVIPETNGRQSFNELCQFVRRSTSPKDVFLIWRPRSFGLFTDRRASVYYLTGSSNDNAALWRYLAKIHANYIVSSDIFPSDRQLLDPFLQRNRKDLELVYQNADFRVYQIKQFEPVTSLVHAN